MKNALTPEQAEKALTSLKEAAQRLSPKVLVLVVEDDSLDMLSLATLLREYSNFEVHEALTAQQAVEMMTIYKFEIIFLDLVLPGMSGINLLEKIGSEMKVILVTGSPPDAPDVIRAVRLGAVDFLRKPVTRELLAKLLK